jgi:hypothetical protein
MVTRATEPTAVPDLFFPKPRFNLNLARDMAEFSRLAYQSALPFTITELADHIVIAFRGTCCIRDWLTDLQVEKTAIEMGAHVHSGFLKAFCSMSLLILPLPKSKPLVITGHSLGGAEATLAAYFLQQEGFTINWVYTFASPRVGNSIWRKVYTDVLGDRTFRVAAAGDLVPLIPGIFTTVRDGYRHVGREVFLHDGRYWLEPHHAWEMAVDGWDAYRAIKRVDVDYILAMHSLPDDYIPCLAKAVEP